MEITQPGYDKSIVAFSPDGRLLQVEYAREAVKRGTTEIGIKCIDGIVLLSTRIIPTKLMETKSIEKIFQIDDNIGAVITGMTADGRILIERLRVEAQINMATYGEPIGIEILTKKISDFIYSYTQSGGIRPFGTSLLIAGMDNNIPRLFETDPSGTLFEYKAIGIGGMRQDVINVLEKEYKEDITMIESTKLGIKILSDLIDVTTSNIEIVCINEKYHKLWKEEIEIYLEDLK